MRPCYWHYHPTKSQINPKNGVFSCDFMHAALEQKHNPNITQVPAAIWHAIADRTWAGWWHQFVFTFPQRYHGYPVQQCCRTSLASYLLLWNLAFSLSHLGVLLHLCSWLWQTQNFYYFRSWLLPCFTYLLSSGSLMDNNCDGPYKKWGSLSEATDPCILLN